MDFLKQMAINQKLLYIFFSRGQKTFQGYRFWWNKTYAQMENIINRIPVNLNTEQITTNYCMINRIMVGTLLCKQAFKELDT